METYMATVVLFAGNFAPVNWAFCQGQTLPISQNAALFSLLGTMYGGDGVTNFCLPNLTHENPNLHYIICMQGIYPPRP
jgi:microcystin-dependent protein